MKIFKKKYVLEEIFCEKSSLKTITRNFISEKLREVLHVSLQACTLGTSSQFIC